MVVLDTDVLLLAFAFQNDKRQPVNTAFLKRVQSAEPAITVYNLMELLGQLSFNLSPTRLDAWQAFLVDAYQLTVVWPAAPDVMDALSYSFFPHINSAPSPEVVASCGRPRLLNRSPSTSLNTVRTASPATLSPPRDRR